MPAIYFPRQKTFEETDRRYHPVSYTHLRIDNLIKAAEQGFVSESSAKRLKELEETKKQQEIALIQEQIKTPLFTTDQIAFAIYKFRQLDLPTREAKRCV